MVHVASKKINVEVKALKIEMLKRGLSSKKLATLAGVHVRVVQNLISGCNHTRPPRAAINRALGAEIFAHRSRKKHSRNKKP